MNHANITTPALNATDAIMAGRNFGASLSGHKYGVYTLARVPSVFVIATASAFFSLVWLPLLPPR